MDQETEKRPGPTGAVEPVKKNQVTEYSFAHPVII
jgi:hypothetical protein